MSIDIRTLILIIGITHLMQVLVFAHQYRVNKNILGPGWWLMWSASEFIGFSLLLLRGIPSLNIPVIALQNPIILTGTIFVYIGILRFFEKKVNLKIILPIVISFVIIHLFFLFIINDITIRTLVFDIYLTTIAFITAFSLFKNKNKSLASTANFNTILFIVQGFVFAYRSFVIISGTGVTDVYSTSVFNMVQYFDALLIGLLWTFGFIIMLNQKLNSEISEAKLHFEQIFNTSPDAACITRLRDGMLVDCNDGYSRISGYSKEEIIGKTTLESNIWHRPHDRIKIVSMVKENGYFENYELLFRRKNGEIITGLMSGKILSIKGEPHIISVTRNISERKKMEESLRESKEKFQQLADLLPQIVFESDIQGKLTYVNKQAYKLFGYAEDENFIGFNTLDFYPPEDKVLAIENIKKSLSGQKSNDSNEYTMIRKDGTTFQGLVYSNPIIKDGNPIGLRGIIVDITKNKQAEEALNQTTTRLKLATRVGGVGVWDWDILKNTMLWDEQMFVLYGISNDDNTVAYETWQACLHPDDKEQAENESKMALEGTKEYNTEFRIVWPDGSIHNIRALAILQRDESGKPLRMIGTNWDITEQKKNEEAIIIQNEELQKLNAEKDKFFSIISNDLKSPFNSIIGFSNILVEQAREKNFEGIEKFADIILQSSLRAMDLLSNLMEWSRSQTGRMIYNPEYFEMVNLINEVTLLLKETAEQKSITINKVLPNNAPVYADKDMISTVLRNLISNAIKFTESKGSVDIKIIQKPNELLVSVSDSGIGISKEVQDELFKINQNLSTPGTNNEQGTGLGLILCKEFIEKHRGKLWVESEVGNGSTFYFTIPISINL
jgi:PAS domain S-box-containing protein